MKKLAIIFLFGLWLGLVNLNCSSLRSKILNLRPGGTVPGQVNR